MAVLVTMQVGPVDWAKFSSAIEALKDVRAPGRMSSEVYRKQSDPNTILLVERWESHDAMHDFQEKVGDDFNRRAGTADMEWQTALWDLV